MLQVSTFVNEIKNFQRTQQSKLSPWYFTTYLHTSVAAVATGSTWPCICTRSIWWNIMVSALILLVFRWHILEITETWTRSKENCSSDAMSVYMCEWNIEFWENMTSRELLTEWVINKATASLSLLNTSGNVAMNRYQWLSNTYAWHYMLTFAASHTWIV